MAQDAARKMAAAAQDKSMQEAMSAEKSIELAKKQAELEFDAKATANLLKPVEKDTAKKVEAAEQAKAVVEAVGGNAVEDKVGQVWIIYHAIDVDRPRFGGQLAVAPVP